MGFSNAKNCLKLLVTVLPVLCRGLYLPISFGTDSPGTPKPATDPCLLVDCAMPECPDPIYIGQCCPVCMRDLLSPTDPCENVDCDMPNPVGDPSPSFPCIGCDMALCKYALFTEGQCCPFCDSWRPWKR